MIKYYYRNIKDKKPTQLKEFKVGAWVDVANPTLNELQFLSSELKLEPGHLRDALDMHEVPRLEIEGDFVYIFTRFPHTEGNNIVTSPILIVYSPRFLATISPKSPYFLETFREKNDFFTTQKVKLMLQVLSEINNAYNYYLHRISRQIRSIEVNLERISNKNISQFVAFEGILNDFRPVLYRTTAILEGLRSGKYLRLYENDRDLVEDIVLSNKQLIDLTDDSIRTIINVREAYTAIMTNNLNRVIKLLTSLTVILTIPTIVSSFFGMNVKIPFEHNPSAFFIILLLVVILSGGLLWVFIREDFI